MDLIRQVHRTQSVIYFVLKPELSANHITHLGHLEQYLKATRKRQDRNEVETINIAWDTFICRTHNSQVIKGAFLGEHS